MSVNMNNRTKWLIALLEGNFIALALVTILGFARHGTLDSASGRMFSTFFPLLIAWLMDAPFLGADDMDNFGDWRQLWRPFWAIIVSWSNGCLFTGINSNCSHYSDFYLNLGWFWCNWDTGLEKFFFVVLSQWRLKKDEEWTK